MKNKPVFINDGGILVKIDVDALLVLEVDNNYVRFIGPDKEYTCKTTLDNALANLPPGLFVQVNRACAVSIRHIEQLDSQHVTVAGQQLVIARGYFSKIKAHLFILGDKRSMAAHALTR